MIGAFLFDLDGVLVKTKDLHFEALNLALKRIGQEYVISYQEHLDIYDGLPTKEKLKLLTAYKDFPIEKYDEVYKIKQSSTSKLLDQILPDPRLRKTLVNVSENGFKIGIVSNSIKTTIEKVCSRLGISDLIDVMISTEEVAKPKPSPDGYIRAMEYFGLSSDQVIIFEDSLVGQRAALSSGGRLAPVDSPDILDSVVNRVILSAKAKRNIVVPMAGNGSRFLSAGYKDPKPMINIFGQTMISHVIQNIKIPGLYTFIVQNKHVESYRIDRTLSYLSPGCKVIHVSSVTPGAAVSVLMAKSIIDNEEELVIANSDQLVELSWDFGYDDGAILLFESTEPKWSFAKVDNGIVTEVAEKEAISNYATCGIYLWKFGKDYVSYATSMVDNNDTVNNEFYVCPAYNYAIRDNKVISPIFVDKMIGLGTPEDLESYIRRSLD